MVYYLEELSRWEANSWIKLRLKSILGAEVKYMAEELLKRLEVPLWQKTKVEESLGQRSLS